MMELLALNLECWQQLVLTSVLVYILLLWLSLWYPLPDFQKLIHEALTKVFESYMYMCFSICFDYNLFSSFIKWYHIRTFWHLGFWNSTKYYCVFSSFFPFAMWTPIGWPHLNKFVDSLGHEHAVTSPILLSRIALLRSVSCSVSAEYSHMHASALQLHEGSYQNTSANTVQCRSVPTPIPGKDPNTNECAIPKGLDRREGFWRPPELGVKESASPLF